MEQFHQELVGGADDGWKLYRLDVSDVRVGCLGDRPPWCRRRATFCPALERQRVETGRVPSSGRRRAPTDKCVADNWADLARGDPGVRPRQLWTRLSFRRQA